VDAMSISLFAFLAFLVLLVALKGTRSKPTTFFKASSAAMAPTTYSTTKVLTNEEANEIVQAFSRKYAPDSNERRLVTEVEGLLRGLRPQSSIEEFNSSVAPGFGPQRIGDSDFDRQAPSVEAAACLLVTQMKLNSDKSSSLHTERNCVVATFKYASGDLFSRVIAMNDNNRQFRVYVAYTA